MTFLISDGVQLEAGTIRVGVYPLWVSPSPSQVCWRLQCPACPAVLSAGAVALGGPLLAGVHTLHAQPGVPAVSWAWGAAPQAERSLEVQVVFARGLRRPVVAAGHLLAGGLWVGAAPVRARGAIAVSGGRSGAAPAEVLAGQDCPGRLADLMPLERSVGGVGRRR